MEHWIEVLFGGVGGTILLGVLGWLWARHSAARSKRKTVTCEETTSAPPLSAGSPSTTVVTSEFVDTEPALSPVTIRQAIRAASPFARPVIANNFKGVTMEWDLILQQVLHHGDGKRLRVRMSSDSSGSYPQILCDVGVHDFPFLKYIHEGSALHARGRIASASEHEIELTQVVLTLLAGNVPGAPDVGR